MAANSAKNAGTIPFSTDNVFTFKNVGLVPLIFCLSATDTVEGTVVAIGGGDTISKAADELNEGATNILVKNTDAKGVGD